jgi:hypothetical protein
MKHGRFRQKRGGRTTLKFLVGVASAWALVPPPAVSAADPGACGANAQSRQLYYWLGDWSVSYSGAPRGSASKVRLALDKCLFAETWQDGKGHKGENYVAYSADDRIGADCLRITMGACTFSWKERLQPGPRSFWDPAADRTANPSSIE